MIDCKLTENYFKEKQRMCENSKCKDCLMRRLNSDKNVFCEQFEKHNIKAAINILQKWSDEHPQKTYLTDFLDKHPNAPLTNGLPSGLCPYYLGYITKKEFDVCSTNCKDCWNTPVVEESEE